jgi:murein DD-endopeptidase MepM/ murein hydrolase activator NlpD
MLGALIHRSRLELAAIAGLALTAATHGNALAATEVPRATDVRCLERCAGLRMGAVGSRVLLRGRRLAHVVEVEFPRASQGVAAAPASVARHRIEVVVPPGARTGRPRPVDASGHGRPAARLLRIVPTTLLPAPGSFHILGARVRPRTPFFDSRRSVRLRYRFGARGTVDVRVKLVRRGRVVKAWKQRDRAPYARHRLRWNGMLAAGRAAPRGGYRFQLQAPGRRTRTAARFRLRDGKFPIRGSHDYGGSLQRFGAPRSGGRVHEGQDVFSPCGTRVVAARGGRVQARGFDPVLYGNWLVIDARGTKTDYRYAHLAHPASAHQGERIRTGERIGRIGKTGNARTVGCQLHLEAWPHGWHGGRPADPLPILKRWDRWS